MTSQPLGFAYISISLREAERHSLIARDFQTVKGIIVEWRCMEIGFSFEIVLQVPCHELCLWQTI